MHVCIVLRLHVTWPDIDMSLMDDLRTIITNYDMKSEVLINFILGTFHQPKPTLHIKVTSTVTINVSQNT